MNKDFNNAVNYFYDDLSRIFTNPLDQNNSKVSKMRTVLTYFMNYIVNPRLQEKCILKDGKIPENMDKQFCELTFNDAANIWMDQRGDFSISNHIRQLRQKMNHIVHTIDIIVNEQELRDYFRDSIITIAGVSGIMPTPKAYELYGTPNNKYLEALNTNQRNIILDNNRIVYVNAGPGTGKTYLLTYKILDLLKKSDFKIKIAAMSFTRSSALSLSDKLDELLDNHNIINKSYPYSGTIHSFCIAMTKSYCHSIGKTYDYIIGDDDDIEEIIEEIAHSLNDLSMDLDTIRKYFFIPEECPDTILSEAISTKRKEFKKISVGEILREFQKLITNDDDFVAYLAGQVDVLLVDEAQDLTETNYKIFDLLLSKIPHLKLFLVGDPRQNIFQFLGGSFHNLESFLEHYQTEASRQVLPTSYRCPSKILDFTNKMEFTECDNYPLDSATSVKGDITIEDFDDEYEEADYVIKYIQNLKDNKKVAILTPQLKNLTVLADKLNDAKIRFKILGGKSSLKPYIAAFNLILKMIKDDIKMVSTANNFIEIIGQPKVKGLYEFNQTDYGKAIKNLHSKYKIKAINFLALSREAYKICRQYYPHYSSADCDPDFTSLFDLVLSKSKDISSYQQKFRKYKPMFSTLDCDLVSTATEGPAITLSTIHSAKGLEWDHVILPAMCDCFLPGENANSSEVKDGHSLDAQRMLLFVAVTRTKKDLLITYPDELRDQNRQMRPCRFLRNLIMEQ